MKKDGDYYVNVPMPFKGLSEQHAYVDQPEGTTANATNVVGFDPRTGRRRISQRHGLSKVANATVNGSESIQDVATLTLPAPTSNGIGSMLSNTFNRTFDEFSLYDVDGNFLYNSTISMGSSLSFCFDGNGDGYVISQVLGGNRSFMASGVYANGTIKFTKALGNQGLTTSLSSSGIGVYNSTIYAYGATSTQSFLFRLYPSNGTPIDGGPWKTNSAGAIIGGGTGRAECLAASSAGVIGIAGCMPSTTSPTIQRIDAVTGTILGNTTLAENSSTRSSIACDDLGNFYLSAKNATGSNYKVHKVNASGATAWSGPNGTEMYGVAYDSKRALVAAVSFNGNSSGTGSKVSLLYASNGAVHSSGNLSSNANYSSAAFDGVSGFRFGGDSKYTSADANLTVQWDVSTGTLVNPTVRPVGSTSFSNNTVPMATSRSVRGLVVAGGVVKRYDGGSIASISNGSVFLAASNTIFSTPNNLYLYFVDGTQYLRYNPYSNAMEEWAPTVGDLPADSINEKCRLICTWRGRIVLSGLRNDPHNWFMSAVDDPLDFDYGASPATETMAVYGGNSEAGLVGDAINCLIPYSDDLLIFGCDHSIWQMSGDPMAGGRIDRISDMTGMAWGRPYCKDPYGSIYFFGSRGGVFKMAPGQGAPTRISKEIDERLARINLANNTVRMAWDDRQQGFGLFITPIGSPAATTHYWYDSRNEAWWPITFANNDHSPKTVCVYDGDSPDDRMVVLGSSDGYVRKLDWSAEDDDGTPITSSILLGPITGKLQQVMNVKELKATLDSASSNVTWEMASGQTEQQALAATARRTGVWTAGDNRWDLVWQSGSSLYLRLSGTDQWAIESLVMRLEQMGLTRRKTGM